jgi:hypothetical protein
MPVVSILQGQLDHSAGPDETRRIYLSGFLDQIQSHQPAAGTYHNQISDGSFEERERA